MCRFIRHRDHPTSDVAPAAFETDDHLISSPASVGSDRFSDLGDLYFGEREDIKLAIAFADPAEVVTTKQAAPTRVDSPQDVTLASLSVANTLGTDALNYGKKFLVSAKQIDGSTDGPSDFYRFYATTGQLINAEAASVILASSGHGRPFDSKLILRDASGTIVASNDNSVETTDAQIIDYQVQHDGYFTIEVASASGAGGDYRLTLSTFEAVSNPAAATGLDHLEGGPAVDHFNYGVGVNRGLSVSGDLSTGSVAPGVTFT